MIEAVVALVLLSVVLGAAVFAVKLLVTLIVLPFKILAWLLGGVLALVLVVPAVLALGAVAVVLVPVVLVVLVCLAPVLVVVAIAAGVFGA